MKRAIDPSKRTPKGFRYEDATHTYSVDGRRIRGVTEILTAAGVVTGQEWFTEEARQRGIAVHKMAELELKKTLDEKTMDERLKPFLFWFRNWVKREGVIPLFQERAVYFRDNLSGIEYGGRVDLVACVRGHISVIDFKTNNRPAWAGYQVAAYAGALKQNEIPVSAGYSVVLSDDGPADMRAVDLPCKWAEWCELAKGVARGE